MPIMLLITILALMAGLALAVAAGTKPAARQAVIAAPRGKRTS
jgi:hypothetical protein